MINCSELNSLNAVLLCYIVGFIFVLLTIVLTCGNNIVSPNSKGVPQELPLSIRTSLFPALEIKLKF